MQNPQRGFSLIEMMVSMTIGLAILGGVTATFSSNLQTAQVKRGYHEAQDTIRFASNLLARVVRQAASVEGGSDTASVQLTMQGGVGVHDCVGAEVPTGLTHTNMLYFEAGQLWCEPHAGDAVPLAEGLADVRFSYGIANAVDGSLHDSDYVDELGEETTHDVRSVRAVLTLPNGTQVSMTTALRARALNL